MKTMHFRLTLMGSCVAEHSFERSGQKFISQRAAHGSSALSRWFFYRLQKSLLRISSHHVECFSLPYTSQVLPLPERDLFSIKYHISQAQLLNYTLQPSIIIQETSSWRKINVSLLTLTPPYTAKQPNLLLCCILIRPATRCGKCSVSFTDNLHAL